MKELDLKGISYLRPLEGTSEWYYALDYARGDLYEEQELYEDGKTLSGNHFFLVHFPDGEVFCPFSPTENIAFSDPVYYDQKISFLAVDFAAGKIRIQQFSCTEHIVTELDALPLSSVKDCYNLRLTVHPLTLTRQPNDGTFELIWPEKKIFSIHERESYYYRDESDLYFSIWYEDPDYREETVIRDAGTGEIRKTLPGDMQIMPNGEIWYLK